MNMLRPTLLVAALAVAAALPAHAQHAGHAPAAPASPPKAAPTDPAQEQPHRDHHAHGGSPEAPSEQAAHSGMNHSQMDHSGMDHSQMDHSQMDHSQMGHAGMPAPADLPPDAPPREPIPPVTDADRAAAFPEVRSHAAHDSAVHSFWLLDRLERSSAEGGGVAWEGLGWIGGDIDRAWVRTEGERNEGELESANVEVLYGHAVNAWWDVVAGVRHDFGEGPSRTYAAIGVQGLAPYKFEVEATAYIGRSGDTAVTLEAEYDTLLTNRLILQWQAEANLHGRDDRARGIGSGLSSIEAGARLRYEITRRFAPYVGIEWERAFGDTADFRRAAGEHTRDTRVVAGIRLWF